MTPGALVEQHLPLVSKIARRLARRLPPSVDVADLISEGTIGLLQAVARYDPARNNSFPLYAQLRIRGAMLDSLRRRHWRAITAAPLEEAAGVSDGSALDERLDRKRAIRCVRALLASLAVADQVVVAAIYRDGCTLAQTAVRTGLSRAAVARIHERVCEQVRVGLRHLRRAVA